jgi:hypothetical protein
MVVTTSTRRNSSLLSISERPIIDDVSLSYANPRGMICLDEIQDSIKILPKFDAKTLAAMNDQNYVKSIELGSEVVSDLRAYVTLISR